MKRRELLQWSASAGSLALLAGRPSTASAALPVPHPTLPQKVDPISATLRRLELTSRQLTYVWTESHLNLAGVPMGAVVPLTELPAVEHQLKTIVRAVEAVINFAASFVTSAAAANRLPTLYALRDRIATLQTRFDQLLAASNGLATLTAALQTLLAALTSDVGDAAAQLKQIHQELLGQGLAGGPKTVAQYDALFVTIERPAVAQLLHDNALFAAMRTAGPNPMLIRRANALPAKFPLGPAQYQQAMGSADTLADAAASGRLYLLDYEGLGAMAPAGPTTKPLTGTGYVAAPIALFARPKDGRSLVPVAIQCGQDPAANPILLRVDDPADAAYWAWQSAKTAVQVADFNYHEMFVHLGRTHLMSEAFAMATQRQLATAHPLNRLLSPHLEGAMFINEAATLLIMMPLTTGDAILGAPIEVLQHECGRDRLAYDFYDSMMLPDELRARGVDDTAALPDYPYRDDALLLWHAIHQWVADYVAVYYLSDADVAGDYELRAWADELAGAGKVKGFRRIATRSQLVDVLTAIIFNASAQHAAVNFPQYSVMTYAPFSAGAMGTPAPTNAAGQNEASWSQMLPAQLAAQEQILLFHILGGVYYRPLGQYLDNAFPHQPVLIDPAIAGQGGPLERFRQALAGIEATIQGRNAARARPYEFLLPSRIPSSTNI